MNQEFYDAVEANPVIAAVSSFYNRHSVAFLQPEC